MLIDDFHKLTRKRIVAMSFFFIVWLVVLSLRLFQIQVLDHAQLKKKVFEQNRNRDIILPKRGTIYDRKGKILAQSLPSPSFFYTSFEDEPSPTQMERISRLKEVLNLSSEELERIKIRIEKKEHFIWIKRKVSPEQAEEVKSLRIPGVFLKEENKRFYPQGRLSAHVLGGVGTDEDGLAGLEHKYDIRLKGKKGECLILRDAKKREYSVETLREPVPGNDIILTLDETVQYIAERELERAILETQASWGTVIISEPSTGEILAMASYPTYDPNHYPPSHPDLEVNRAVRYNFEPGSTFKIVTASAALEAQCVQVDDIFDCGDGAITVAGQVIKDHKKFSLLSFPQVIQHSSNVGAIRIGLRIPKNDFHQTIKSFGFGERTKIDLPGEEMGIFRAPKDWTEISQASLSFGHEISVTAIQLLQAMNIIANRGVMVTPKIVKKILTSPDEERVRPSHYKRVLSEVTASTMAQVLELVTLGGTGKTARIEGYRIAGKTGTAQKFDPEINAYSSTLHTASFVGFVPIDEPAFSMIIVLDNPKGKYYGGEIAAPVFRRIAEQLLIYLRIPPQEDTAKPLLFAHLWREDQR